MFIIKSKNESYSGVVSGIVFVNGEAKTNFLSDSDIAWFEKYEYEVIKPVKEKPTEEKPKEKKTKK